ncbi:MAG TPA: family 43 glycosylhydrolase [Steroidobacter sp.]|uniref:family 43 glycosylhydrolase n=1 Tax=Steroidobacter sp. TaxID=1978227 RepID=UPI002ED79A91
MLRRIFLLSAAFFALPALALEGEVIVHDPSTIIFHGGRYYTYGTGAGIPILTSEDGWAWKRAGSLMSAVPGGKAGPEVLAKGGNNTWAPDVIKVGDQFFVYYSAPGTQPKSAIGLLVCPTLAPEDPDYKCEDRGPVVWSDGVEDSNAIDPGVLLDPERRLWLVYGSYFGYIRLVELDPKTGLRRDPERKPVNVAINSEAAILIHRDGWYYLLVTHGSCCQGANSTYNIRMGRSRKVTGPYLDNMGVDMIEGGGKLFAASRGRHIGPGHFGLLDLGEGVQKFSLHYEADLDRGAVSVLDIRPLLWRDGWPVAGDNLVAGTYSIESARTGTVLELAVQGSPVGGLRQRRGGPPGSGIVGSAPPASGPPPEAAPFVPQIGPPIADQEPAHVAANWPAVTRVRLAPAMLQAQQKWVIAPVASAGGYPGAPYFRITIAGTERSLTATQGGELEATSFTGAPEQLWRIDQLIDGTYRISPKSVPNSSATWALSAVGSSTPTLSKFDPASDRQRWLLGAP